MKKNGISFTIIKINKYNEFSNIYLQQAFPVKDTEIIKEWMCECKNGDLLRVNYTAGLVCMLRGETEYDVLGNPNILKPVMGIDKKEDIKNCTFEDIKKSMRWKIKKENYIL